MKLLTEHLPQDSDGYGAIILCLATGELQITAQRGIDRCLVPDAFGFGFGSEVLDDVIVKHDRDTGLARRGNDCTFLATREVVLLTHDIALLRRDWLCAPRST
ncbi:hypothetical protein [Dokdonella sp.]|uniref:hypothetical protein n=1 Tax=Dokdonella sp. TaxID=2291710 RepID=UPI0025B878C8|nr:hypothetical protein [Dokdonella sp.]